MIVKPSRYIDAFADGGAAIITVHYEACTHLHRVIQQIKAQGCKAGVALNPHTPVSLLKDVLHDIDLVLVMSVNPGFGGQQFISQALSKVAELRQLANALHPGLLIEVDGGVGLSNAGSLLQAGANALVAGNAIFAAPDPVQMIRELKNIDIHRHDI
ncbi:Ribulose-phosphate 3-epimerase [compost metagenome]